MGLLRYGNTFFLALAGPFNPVRVWRHTWRRPWLAECGACEGLPIGVAEALAQLLGHSMLP